MAHLNTQITKHGYAWFSLLLLSPCFFHSLISLFNLQFFSYISFFLHHCKLFPSLLLKWHLQMRVKSGRQWISNWKRHWTEDNATGSVISNRMIWNVKWCEIVAELNFMLPPSSMQHFFSKPVFRPLSKNLIRLLLCEHHIHTGSKKKKPHKA